jgi:hypothetical protein
MGATFSNLDPSFITETLTRQVSVAVSSGSSQILGDVMKLASLNPEKLQGMNYWELGQSVGRLIKALFDFNINN